VRLALGACARTLAGKAAAGSTQRRKRSVFYNTLGPDGPAILVEGLRAQFPQLARAAREVMANWLDTYVLTARRD
jgi:hypothetical protein